MINLDFLPSRQIAFYLIKLFLTRSAAVLVLLTLVLMALDLLGEAGQILRVEGNGEAELWRYVTLRIPLLIQRFLPFSILLGTLIVFTGLSQHSEVVAMKASGLSAHQILAPLILASVGIAGLAFAFNETVAVKAARTVNVWTDNDYEPIRAQSDVLSNVWLRVDSDFVRARLVNGRGPNLTLGNVRLYERNGPTRERVVDIERAVQDGVGAGGRGRPDLRCRVNLVRRQPVAYGLDGVAPEQFTLAGQTVRTASPPFAGPSPNSKLRAGHG